MRAGDRLAKAAEKISVVEIIDAVEGRKSLFDCPVIRGRCVLFEANRQHGPQAASDAWSASILFQSCSGNAGSRSQIQNILCKNESSSGGGAFFREVRLYLNSRGRESWAARRDLLFERLANRKAP
jgi:hypothetical protein